MKVARRGLCHGLPLQQGSHSDPVAAGRQQPLEGGHARLGGHMTSCHGILTREGEQVVEEVCKDVSSG